MALSGILTRKWWDFIQDAPLMAVPTVSSFIPAVDGSTTYKIPGNVFISAATVIATGSLLSRTLPDRFADRINIKDYAVGDGSSQTAGISAWNTSLNTTYSTTTPGNVGQIARGGYIPGSRFTSVPVTATDIVAGLRYKIVTVGTTNWVAIGALANAAGVTFTATAAGTGTGTASLNLATKGYGYSVFGDGRPSQLENATFETMDVNARLGNFAIVGDGTGTGLHIRSAQLIALGIDFQNHDIAVKATNGSLPGGLGANNTLAFGSLRSSRIGASVANNDFRLMFYRTAFLEECGIDCWDGGGYHFLGNNIFCDAGPALRLRGSSNTFTGNLTLGSLVITNVSNFAGVEIDAVVSSTGNISGNSRIIAFNQGAGTITIDRPALAAGTGVSLQITKVPIESFFVDNTLNSGREDYLTFDIDSITDAGGGNIRVVLDGEYFGISLGNQRIRFFNTNVVSYDDNSAPQNRHIVAIENWSTIVVNQAYAGNSAPGGTIAFNNFDTEVLSEGSNAFVREHFFLGNNTNQVLFQGGNQFGFIGTRINGRMWLDGFRPFRGTATNGSPIITAITGINTNELREGILISTSTASFPTGTTILSVDSPTQITLSNPATEDAAGTLISSPLTPNNIFHIPAGVDNATLEDTGVTQPSGPGSTTAWAQIGMFPDFAPDYTTTPGSYYAGIRVPFSAGGMVNGQAQYLNEFGPTNTGFHLKTNSLKYFIAGSEWAINDDRTFFVSSIASVNAGASILLTCEQTSPLVVGVDRVYLTGTGIVGYDGVEAVVEAKPRADQIQLPITFVSDLTTVAATALTINRRYTIVTVGTTNWTLVGALVNQVGESFVANATGTGTGTGTAKHVGTLNTDASTIIFREGAPSAGGGSSILSSGRPMVVEARAYLNNSNTIYGNSMFRWRAPRLGTAINQTAVGGAFAVLPGNSANTDVHFFLGATNTSVDLTGDAASIQALNTGTMELRESGVTSWYFGSTTPWASLTPTGNSFVTVSQNDARRFVFTNANTGAAAEGNIEVRQTALGSTTAVRMAVYSTGFTTAGIAFQDGGAIYSDTLLSGGLSVAALAGNLRIQAAAQVVMPTLPLADPGIPGAIWVDAGAARVLKQSP